jgi:heat shock protein HslJ
MVSSAKKRMRSRSFLAAATTLASLAFLASCDDVTSPSDLMGGVWRLESLQSPDLGTRTPDDPDKYTVEFVESARVNVQADCNGCSGQYSLAEDSLTVSDLACTLIACLAPSLDGEFLRILNGVSTVDVEADEMRISSSRGTLLFTR